jgi:hypothetical protein
MKGIIDGLRFLLLVCGGILMRNWIIIVVILATGVMTNC